MMIWGIEVVKATVLLLVAGVVTLLLRRASAATRHLVWALGLAGLLALPVAGRLLPEWPVPLWMRAGGDISVLTFAGAGPVETAGRHSVWGMVWAAGAAVVLARLLAGLLAVRRLARRARPLQDDSWRALLDGLTKRLRLTRPMILLECDRATMPMTWGVRRATILLPAGAGQWTAELRRDVLAHELAHVQRSDCAVQVLAKVACALYWFHPLAWVAARQLVRESERACDDQVSGAARRHASTPVICWRWRAGSDRASPGPGLPRGWVAVPNWKAGSCASWIGA